MAITYPRSLPPELIISGSDFALHFQNSGPRQTLAGGVVVTEVGDPFWTCAIEMAATTVPKAVALRAWKKTLRGGQKTFLAHDHAVPRPAAYASDSAVLALTRSGGGAFDGTAVITGFPGARQIAISSASSSRLPAGFIVSAGDMLGLVKPGSPNKYFLHQAVEMVVADVSGNITISVEPYVFTNIFAAGDTLNFLKPLGEFVFVDDEKDGLVRNRDNSFKLNGVSRVM